jgi:hypothetical protein
LASDHREHHHVWDGPVEVLSRLQGEGEMYKHVEIWREKLTSRPVWECLYLHPTRTAYHSLSGCQRESLRVEWEASRSFCRGGLFAVDNARVRVGRRL